MNAGNRSSLWLFLRQSVRAQIVTVDVCRSALPLNRTANYLLGGLGMRIPRACGIGRLLLPVAEQDQKVIYVRDLIKLVAVIISLSWRVRRFDCTLLEVSILEGHVQRFDF